MKIVLADCPLKHLLQLFEAETPLQIHELGDTGHPSSGYVDQALAAGVTTVGQLRAHDYDFGGLVLLAAALPDLVLRYHDEQYECSGPDKNIWRLIRRVAELNAQPDFSPKLQVIAQRAD